VLGECFSFLFMLKHENLCQLNDEVIVRHGMLRFEAREDHMQHAALQDKPAK